MKRRIFGLENEYGLTCMLDGQSRLSPDNIARYLFERVIPGARNANVFLENGARLYLDTNGAVSSAARRCLTSTAGTTKTFSDRREIALAREKRHGQEVEERERVG